MKKKQQNNQTFIEDVIQGLPDGEHISVAIVVSSYNGNISNGLLTGAIKALDKCQVKMENRFIYAVDGAVEIPIIAQRVIKQKKVDAVIALGCVIQGDTSHFDYVCHMVADGCNRVSLDMSVPIAFGVLTTDNEEQAIERSSLNMDTNKGYEAALTAVKTISLLHLID